MYTVLNILNILYYFLEDQVRVQELLPPALERVGGIDAPRLVINVVCTVYTLANFENRHIQYKYLSIRSI